MTRRNVQVDDTTFTISAIEAPLVGHRQCALLHVELIDETTGRAPVTTISARLTTPSAADASVRVVHQGLVGVVGRPARAFSPSLATIGRIELDLEAARFARRHISVRFACGLRTLASTAVTPVLTLNSNANLQAGQRLLLGTADGSRVEFGTIAAVGPGANQVTLQQILNFPYPAGSQVQPLPATQAVELHRKPISIAGRILRRVGATDQPLAGARVQVSKVWRQMPPAGMTVIPELPVPGGPVPALPWDAPIAVLSPPGYADFPTTSLLEIEDRAVDGATAAKALIADVVAGSTELRLSNAVGLSVNDVISVDADDDGRREIVVIRAISSSGAASDWSTVKINHPLAFDHRRNRTVRRLQAPAPGASRALNYAALRGDEAVLFDSTGIVGSHQVRLVDSGPPVVEAFHRIDLLTSRSNADGFYRLPPITRVGKIEIFAKDAGSAANKTIEFVPDYNMPENRVDIVVN
jgi:hypothetical protein